MGYDNNTGTFKYWKQESRQILRSRNVVFEKKGGNSSILDIDEEGFLKAEFPQDEAVKEEKPKAEMPEEPKPEESKGKEPEKPEEQEPKKEVVPFEPRRSG